MQRQDLRNRAILVLRKNNFKLTDIASLFPPLSKQRVSQVIREEESRVDKPLTESRR